MMKRAKEQFRDAGFSEENMLFEFVGDMRYMGQEHTVKVPMPCAPWSERDIEGIVESFHDIHERTFTYRLPRDPAEIVDMHLICTGKQDKPETAKTEPHRGSAETAKTGERKVYFTDEKWVDCPVYCRGSLGSGAVIHGPALVEEESACTVINTGQMLTVDDYGNLILEIVRNC